MQLGSLSMTHAKGATTAAIPECNKDGAMMLYFLCDNFVSYLVPTKNHAGPNPHDIDAVRERSPENLMCFTL